jgi:2-oxoglutarate dehydrogenase E2 component (dihydrolipoamide succinyltransferase)
MTTTMTPLKIPDVGESIQEVQIGRWLKAQGDMVQQDESVVELETDKASMELPSPIRGRLSKILKQDGQRVSIGEVIAQLEPLAQGEAEPTAPTEEEVTAAEAVAEPAGEAAAVGRQQPPAAPREEDGQRRTRPITPSGRRALRQHGLSPADIEPEGKRIRREDVERHVAHGREEREQEPAKAEPPAAVPAGQQPTEVAGAATAELEELVPMSLIRRRIAERLVEAQRTAALLTTFNEIDMSSVIELRQKHQDAFQERYHVKLGFMSFFVKASIDALKQFPAINAEIRGDNEHILYRDYYHIGIAIGSPKGLVVPVLRFAERMSFAEIEQAIGDLAARARDNKIGPDELQGGTFTISNGGIYGSLLSTPIVNPPQSGVLGMHTIQERPIARQGQVLVRPMMYVALTYDHRIVDGAEAVSFLKRVKESIEEPARMLVEV